MGKTIIQLSLLAIVLILAQVIVFNNICLFNLATPIVFIYLILRLPVTLSVNWTMTIGFFLGLIIDIFSDTYGMNALACTILAGLKHPILHLYISREEDMLRPEPSLYSLGTPAYLKYLLTATLLYCVVIYTIEAFTLFNPLRLILRIITSTALSLIIMLGIDSLFTPRK
ncbi:MAG: rod shape-determining protein MreD [Lachnoclostridium sp.]|nr:rod shape-determining protein MreD [Lachnoclostridium sp.]